MIHELETTECRTERIAVDIGPAKLSQDLRLMCGISDLIEQIAGTDADMGSEDLGRVASWVFARWGGGKQP